jgi:hypothetical protein
MKKMRRIHWQLPRNSSSRLTQSVSLIFLSWGSQLTPKRMKLINAPFAGLLESV